LPRGAIILPQFIMIHPFRYIDILTKYIYEFYIDDKSAYS